jgi:hypothetical protein
MELQAQPRAKAGKPMAQAGPQDMAVFPTQVVVCSESDPGTTYLVQLPYCPCKDFRYRRSNPEKFPDSPYCKHIREAMRRVAGWHRQAPAGPEVHDGLTDVAVKELLRSTTIGFGPRESNALVHRAVKAEGLPVPFAASLTGALVDGTLSYERVQSQYTLVVHR